jgi:hypothetical protein
MSLNQPTDAEIDRLDPYAFMAAIGKRVIHPGGRRSTREMFVDRQRAVREVARVCRPTGRILDHEFIYRRPPTMEIRRIFEGEVCPGIRFDTAADWLALYQAVGLSNLQHTTGPFSMMTPFGMVRDEGIRNLGAMVVRVAARRAYRRKMLWLMSRMLRVSPYLGYVVLVGTKLAPAHFGAA